MKAGVTGHQELTIAYDWIHSQVDRLLSEYGVDFGTTSLAAGADQLFAECLIERSIPFRVIVPCASYEMAFQSKNALEKYQTYLQLAQSIEQLDFDAPSEKAFWRAGQIVVERSALLIAIWDGKPARGLGGTGDVVAYAQKRGRMVIQLEPNTRMMTILQP
jgi:hypothetical protein